MRTLKLRILVASAALLWAGIGASQNHGLEDIEEFVRQIYVHGIPFEEANRYDASVAPTLLKMLNDPKEQDYWSNIVTTLGIIGDENAVEPMIEFIEKGKAGALTRSQRQAKKSAIMSLGYLINKSGNQKALDYLTTNMTPPPMPAMTSLAGGPSAATTPDLSKYAVLGLALSGHPKAAEKLKSLQESSRPSAWASLRTMLGAGNSGPDTKSTVPSEVISEALRANEEIADKGLAEYYRGSRP